jgi:hypothetical protein
MVRLFNAGHDPTAPAGVGDTCLHRIALFLQLSEALQDSFLVLGAVGISASRIYTSVVCWWLVVVVLEQEHK